MREKSCAAAPSQVSNTTNTRVGAGMREQGGCGDHWLSQGICYTQVLQDNTEYPMCILSSFSNHS